MDLRIADLLGQAIDGFGIVSSADEERSYQSKQGMGWSTNSTPPTTKTTATASCFSLTNLFKKRSVGCTKGLPMKATVHGKLSRDWIGSIFNKWDTA